VKILYLYSEAMGYTIATVDALAKRGAGGPEVVELFGSIGKASGELGWEPAIPLAVSLEDAYRHWHDSLG